VIKDYMASIQRELDSEEPYMTPSIIAAFKHMDSDYDGKLSLEEWLQCIEVPPVYTRFTVLFANLVAPHAARPMLFKEAPHTKVADLTLCSSREVVLEHCPAFPTWKANGENTHVGNLATHAEAFKAQELYGSRPQVSIGLISEVRHGHISEGEVEAGIVHYHSKALQGLKAAIIQWNDTSDIFASLPVSIAF